MAFQFIKTGEFLNFRSIISIGMQLCYITGCKMNYKKQDVGDFLIIILFNIFRTGTNIKYWVSKLNYHFFQ